MVQRLETGGPVLGIFTDVQYEQGQLQLQPYDALIAYTDGISEAMTSRLRGMGRRAPDRGSQDEHSPLRAGYRHRGRASAPTGLPRVQSKMTTSPWSS